MQCGYCGEQIAEGEDFCKKCVEGYKIGNKKNTVSAAKQRPRKIKSSSKITPEKIARSPFAKTGLRMIGFIGGAIIVGIVITALVGGSPTPQYVEPIYVYEDPDWGGYYP